MTKLSPTHAAVFIAGSLAVALLASAAMAQDYPDSDTASYQGPNGEEVEVTAPRQYQRGEYGAPIRDVAISRPVRFDDLDLGTRHGAHLLRARIRTTARLLCNEIERMHPVAADDNPPCYPNAVHDAMLQANDVIADARDEDQNEQ